MDVVAQIKKDLRKFATSKKANASAWFFKTGPGQYGFGDKFIGVTVPEQRVIAKKYSDINLAEIDKLLKSDIHEERLTALLILVDQFKRADIKKREIIFQLYIANLKFVNNWDLVDSSAHQIVGEYVRDKKITLLLVLAKSQRIWDRRIAIVATFAFLNNGDSTPTYRIADLLLDDREDLIQKAVGWLLREAGKKVSTLELENYIRTNYTKLGRTTLRYAIERFSKEKRKNYLLGVI